MMPVTRLRRKSKIFWPPAKIILIFLVVVILLGLVVLVLTNLRGSNIGQKSLILPAATSLSTSDQQLAEVVSFLANLGLAPSDLKINGEELEFKLAKTLIILPISNNLNPKLLILEKVWRQYELSRTPLNKIDLRYNYPLVSY